MIDYKNLEVLFIQNSSIPKKIGGHSFCFYSNYLINNTKLISFDTFTFKWNFFFNNPVEG